MHKPVVRKNYEKENDMKNPVLPPSIQTPPCLFVSFPFQNFVADENKYSDLGKLEINFPAKLMPKKKSDQTKFARLPLRIKWSLPYTQAIQLQSTILRDLVD